MKLLFNAYKVDITANGIPQITRPTPILIKNFVVRCFLHDFNAVSLKIDKLFFTRLDHSYSVFEFETNGTSEEVSAVHGWYFAICRSSVILYCGRFWEKLVDNGTISLIVAIVSDGIIYLNVIKIR